MKKPKIIVYHNTIRDKKVYTTKSVSKMLCKCECGTEKEVVMINLKNGRSTQCMSCAGKNKGKKKNENII